MLGASAPVAAQLTDAPEPIPAPPIPGTPKLAPAPKFTLGSPVAPGRPLIDIPGVPTVAAVSIPAIPLMTPADRSDPTPPRQGIGTDPPPAVSPGADPTKIEEIAFIVDPGSSEISSSARAKLLHMAQSLRDTPMARIEIRAYSPVKGESESDPRRLSLARWLAVRDYLVQNGVADERIDGRALGSAPTEPNADRIELYLEP